ncbi:MAG: Sortase family protein [Nocardioidaceae bacterium]|nr:Sortase family protein [Nocardioidaceae bacterium]
MSATSSAARGSGLVAWLLSLLVGMVGLGLVIPSGHVDAAPRLIGKRTGDVLVIPALRVRAPLVSVAMDPKNVLSPPRNPREVGYWDGSARPGSSTGQTLITGHTVHTGGGALDRLGTLAPGAQVRVVRTSNGETRRSTYVVTEVRDLSKAEVARDATALFGQAGGTGRLVLVTCTGWDGKEYHGNTVVFARPVDTATAA